MCLQSKETHRGNHHRSNDTALSHQRWLGSSKRIHFLDSSFKTYSLARTIKGEYYLIFLLSEVNVHTMYNTIRSIIESQILLTMTYFIKDGFSFRSSIDITDKMAFVTLSVSTLYLSY